MASKNDITGDFIVNKPNSKMFEENYDNIFRKKIEWEDEVAQEEHDAHIKKEDNGTDL